MATTWWPEFTRNSHTALPVHPQESRKRTTPPVNRNSAVRIPLRRSKQTEFCWPFSIWQTTTIVQTCIIISTEIPKCQNRSPERCQLLTGNLRSLSCVKISSKLASKDDRINYFHSLMGGDALHTFKNINGPNRENLRVFLAVFRRKYVKPQSMATAKNKFQKFVFNPANQKLVNFLDELQNLSKDAFGIDAHAIIEQLIYAKMQPHLEKSKNQAHLEIGTYQQIVTHLEKDIELNGMEALDDLQISTVTHNIANTNADRPKPTCHHFKKPGLYRNQCRLLKRQKE